MVRVPSKVPTLPGTVTDPATTPPAMSLSVYKILAVQASMPQAKVVSSNASEETQDELTEPVGRYCSAGSQLFVSEPG